MSFDQKLVPHASKSDRRDFAVVARLLKLDEQWLGSVLDRLDHWYVEHNLASGTIIFHGEVVGPPPDRVRERHTYSTMLEAEVAPFYNPRAVKLAIEKFVNRLLASRPLVSPSHALTVAAVQQHAIMGRIFADEVKQFWQASVPDSMVDAEDCSSDKTSEAAGKVFRQAEQAHELAQAKDRIVHSIRQAGEKALVELVIQKVDEKIDDIVRHNNLADPSSPEKYLRYCPVYSGRFGGQPTYIAVRPQPDLTAYEHWRLNELEVGSITGNAVAFITDNPDLARHIIPIPKTYEYQIVELTYDKRKWIPSHTLDQIVTDLATEARNDEERELDKRAGKAAAG